MISKLLPAFRHAGLALSFALLSLTSSAQDQDADISKMGHMKLRSYLKENGLKAKSRQIVKVGDELQLGAGSMVDKRFAFIYQSPQGLGSGSSYDGEIKAYLTSDARGRKAKVKTFITSGMKKGQYSIYVVVGVGELDNYWVELDNAIETGEVILPKN